MALASIFDCSFGTALSVTVWVILPLYAACLGVALSFLAKLPAAASYKKWATEGAVASSFLPFQLLFYWSVFSLVVSYRGYEGTFFQGQLLLTAASAKVLFLVLGFLGLAAAVSNILQGTNPRVGALGTSV
jgi:hypothetical protein